jgi:hypothetical protein
VISSCTEQPAARTQIERRVFDASEQSQDGQEGWNLAEILVALGVPDVVGALPKLRRRRRTVCPGEPLWEETPAYVPLDLSGLDGCGSYVQFDPF